MNITFDLLLESINRKIWVPVFVFVNLCCEVFLMIMVVLGFHLCWINRIEYSTTLHINMGIVMMAIPLGGLFMLFEQIAYQINAMKKHKYNTMHNNEYANEAA